MAADKIRGLVMRRDVCLNRMKETHQAALNASKDKNCIPIFYARAEETDLINDEFYKIHNQILSLIEEEDFRDHDVIRIAFDQFYYDIKSRKNVMQGAETPTVSPPPVAEASFHSSSNVKLPKFNLPTFEGNIKDWPSFFDLYTSLIHQNDHISKVEKFQYLIMCLSKEALGVVKGLPITEANYTVAYDTLVRRYNNKRLLATSYYNELYTLQALQRASSYELRQTLDTFTENVLALKALSFPVESWDFLIFNMLLQKLDSKTKTAFELEFSNVELPSFSDLTTFLEERCKALESSQFTNPNTVHRNTPSNRKSNMSSFCTSTAAATSMHQAPKKGCIICSSSHLLYRCPTFTSKTPSERFTVVKQHNYCVNCLQSPHSLRNCRSNSRCRICNAPHHTMLHLNKDTQMASAVSPNSSATPLDLQPSGSNLAHSGAIHPSFNSHLSQDPNYSQTHQATSQIRVDPQKHHSNSTILSTTPLPQTQTFQSQGLSSMNTSTFYSPIKTVLLSTAIVEVLDSQGNFQKIRVLFDSGSMANFISESCANRLGLSRSSCAIPIEGLSDMSLPTNKGITSCVIRPVGQEKPSFHFQAIVLPKVCSQQPKSTIDVSQWHHLCNLKLADSSFNSPGKIDLLLGAELVPYMLGTNRIFGKQGQPVALESVFGWVLQGPVENTEQISNSSFQSFHVSIDPPLDTLIKSFWEVEQVKPISELNIQEQNVEEFYKGTYRREPSGRFIVSLPFCPNSPSLGKSYDMALRRFMYLEARLLKQPILYEQYCNFMTEYLKAQHMSLVPPEERHSSNAFYLPHHCVVRPDSTSTPVRVVFDGSAKSSNGVSLNDILLTGPKLHQDLAVILLRFKFFPVVFTCDIKQMFTHILVAPECRDYQRIFWRRSKHLPIEEYRLNTVTFGLSCSPFLAMRTIRELAFLEKGEFPKACEVLENSVFVDDIVYGGNTVDEVLQLQQDLITVLKKGGFELRKWTSNHPSILLAVSQTDTPVPMSFTKQGPAITKVLGLQWNPSTDMFFYSFTATQRIPTKRNILSDISKIFDPNGLLSPVTLKAKHLMQMLWTSNTDWEELPPEHIATEWKRFSAELPCLSNIEIPRRGVLSNAVNVQLHGFCDASIIGYSAVVYLRVENAERKVETFLITGKAKVAPLKTISIPRLELMAAVLLTELVEFVQRAYTGLLTFNSIFCWSDSRVALCWLTSSPHKWKTFIANRIARAQDIISVNCWRYVPSADNPADCSSRGLLPSQLCNHPLWWKGPPWLKLPTDCWPKQSVFASPPPTEAAAEQKSTALVCSQHTLTMHIISHLLNKFSSLEKILNILGYVLRFKRNSLKHSERSRGSLSPDELQDAQYKIVYFVQQETFETLISQIKSNTLLPKPFRKLAPFIDPSGLIRVGGRLKHSQLHYEVRHPLLLPKNHRFTDLVIDNLHKRYLHPGLKTMHYLLLQQYWVLSPRSAIYRCLSRCIRCFRSKPKSYEPFMGDLPSFRISQIKPFCKTGLDMAGPFPVTMGRLRGAKVTKAYICIFVCEATKAVHIELTSDLSTEVFLAALRRFIARRGRCTDFYSDQGSNFIGAHNQLKEYARAACETLSLKWHFNPPGAPHFNGLIEAGVKSVKTHLYRVIGEQILTFEELYTLLTQVEALLNSRPLYPLSEDPNDLCALTPGHFLTLEPLNSAIPEVDLTHLKISRLSRWQLIQKMHADFWKRWHAEYLHTLQQRSKWVQQTPPLQEGSLVLIKNELRPPLQWALARVVQLHPGRDGITRVATVKTARGSYQRPVVKLCPLPLHD